MLTLAIDMHSRVQGCALESSEKVHLTFQVRPISRFYIPGRIQRTSAPTTNIDEFV